MSRDHAMSWHGHMLWVNNFCFGDRWLVKANSSGDEENRECNFDTAFSFPGIFVFSTVKNARVVRVTCFHLNGRTRN